MATVFGLVTYKGAIAALELQDVTYGESGSTSEPLKEDGTVEQIDTYGDKVTLQANGNVKTGANMAALTRGATLTVDSIAYKITDVQIKESVTGAKTCSISGSAPKPVPAG